MLPLASHAADALRPDVAKPLNAAQDLYRGHKYKDALTKIDQAAAVPGKTPYEGTMIEEMRGAAAAAAGESGIAAQAYETLLSSGKLAGADEQRTTTALASIYFQQKNYAQAAKVAQRYLTQLAIVAGTTAEGKQVIDQGFASGVLGHDPQADREKRLQALAAKRAQAPADPANPVAPVDVGFNEVFAGQYRQGLAAMDAAIAKGGLDHPDQAQLRLGEA